MDRSPLRLSRREKIRRFCPLKKAGVSASPTIGLRVASPTCAGEGGRHHPTCRPKPGKRRLIPNAEGLERGRREAVCGVAGASGPIPGLCSTKRSSWRKSRLGKPASSPQLMTLPHHIPGCSAR